MSLFRIKKTGKEKKHKQVTDLVVWESEEELRARLKTDLEKIVSKAHPSRQEIVKSRLDAWKDKTAKKVRRRKRQGRLAAGLLTGTILFFSIYQVLSRDYKTTLAFTRSHSGHLVYTGVDKTLPLNPFDRILLSLSARQSELSKTKELLYSIDDVKTGDYVLVVNKQNQKAQLYKLDYTLVDEAETSTGINSGDKERGGDHKTPEGMFEVVSVNNSSEWVHNGEFVYGPYFLRLNCGSYDPQGNHNPEGRSSIGVHGTNEPYNLGSKASRGCIRLNNQDIRRYVENGFLKKGSKVLIIPGLGLSGYQASANPESLENTLPGDNQSGQTSNDYYQDYEVNINSLGLEAILGAEKSLQKKPEKNQENAMKKEEEEENKQNKYNKKGDL